MIWQRIKCFFLGHAWEVEQGPSKYSSVYSCSRCPKEYIVRKIDEVYIVEDTVK